MDCIQLCGFYCASPWANGIAYHFNPVAAQYMLTYGYMLDDSTYVAEVHRLMPGCYGVIGGPTMASYYKDKALAYGKPRKPLP